MKQPLFLKQIAMPHPLPAQDAYLRDLAVVRHLRAQPITLRRPVTMLVGENGSGKSTLLEAVALALGMNAEGGGRNYRFATQNTHSALWQALRLGRGRMPQDTFFLRAESFYSMASYIDELDDLNTQYGGSLHEKSHGESFLALVQHRLRGDGLYLLDEPEAALSPMRTLTLLAEMHRLVGQGAQFLIATHSPILMMYPGAELLHIDEAGVAPIAWRDTEHYRTMKLVLDAPEQVLYHLLGENNRDETGC